MLKSMLQKQVVEAVHVLDCDADKFCKRGVCITFRNRCISQKQSRYRNRVTAVYGMTYTMKLEDQMLE